MNESYVVPVLCGLLILLCTLLAVVMAYREGKRIGALTRSDRFDRLDSPLRLSETEWQIEFDEYETSVRHTAWIRFRQYGTRIIGEGEDSQGRCCSAEGVVYADKLCYLYLDRGRGGHALGTVMVDMNDAGDCLDGMRCSWSVDRGAVSVDRIRLTRSQPALTPTGSVAASDVALPMGHFGDTCSEKATLANHV